MMIKGFEINNDGTGFVDPKELEEKQKTYKK